MNQRLRDLIDACWRFDFYATAVARPLRRALAALALLSLVYAGSNLVYATFFILPPVETAARTMPKMTIDQGYVSFEIRDPADILVDPKNHLYIGTWFKSGWSSNSSRSLNPDWKIFSYGHFINIIDPRDWGWELTLPRTYTATITKDQAVTFLQSWQPALLAGWGAVNFLWFFLSRLLLAAVLAFLPFADDKKFFFAFKIALYAFVPATIFGLILQWLNAFFVVPPIWIGYAFVPYFLIVLIYFVGGFLDTRKKDATLVQ